MSERRRLYGLLFDTVLTRLDAERAHHAGVRAVAAAGRTPLAGPAVRRVSAPRDPVLRVHALGHDLPGPLGLAAGFDKDAVAVDGLAALGFGFVEVGTVTAQPQPGNPRPRLVRLPADRAVVNRMGFNNAGAVAVAERLRRRREGRHLPVAVGVNIGRTKVATDAIGDLVASTTALAPYADYLVVNVSSPNTPGLRDLQAVERLRPLLAAVRVAAGEAATSHVPLLVKIAPDLTEDDSRAVADLALDLDLAGIVATNTTVSRAALSSPPAVVAAAGGGGLSGPVLAQRSLEVLRLLRARVGEQLALVSVGGVWTGADAYARIRAGATLVQGWTAFVYEGPRWPARVHRELATLLRRDGYTRVADAVGADAVRAR